MATKTAFKQQCPSCEAMVPIRDSGLIGKKIDCPKCKYRFVVEEPEGEEDDLDEKSGKGKKGGAAVTAKRPVNGKATVKGKGGLQQRPDEEDDEEDVPQKKGKGPSTTLVLGIGLAAVAV